MLVRQDLYPDESLAWEARYMGSFTSQGHEHLQLDKRAVLCKYMTVACLPAITALESQTGFKRELGKLYGKALCFQHRFVKKMREAIFGKAVLYFNCSWRLYPSFGDGLGHKWPRTDLTPWVKKRTKKTVM